VVILKKVAIMILLGQSNAVGHGIPMDPADYISTPLKNVFGLHRDQNQSFTNQELHWAGYVSAGMNLAETQDHTYSVANCLAKTWQAEIDAGNPRNLPDLYIVQIAIGAQGIGRNDMWYPDREPVLIPGVLGTVNISLYPYTLHIFSLLRKWLEQEALEPTYLGIHWRGGEQDILEASDYLQEHLLGLYHRLFDGFTEALGQAVPIILHHYPYDKNMRNRGEENPRFMANMALINDIFRQLAKDYPQISIFDIRNSPLYQPELSNDGLFIDDLIHYRPAANQWTAEQILANFSENTNSL
jgi:hypothetical protein